MGSGHERRGQMMTGGLGTTLGQGTMVGRQQGLVKAPVASLQLLGGDQPVETVALHAAAQGRGLRKAVAFHQDQATAMAHGLRKGAESRLGEQPVHRGA